MKTIKLKNFFISWLKGTLMIFSTFIFIQFSMNLGNSFMRGERLSPNVVIHIPLVVSLLAGLIYSIQNLKNSSKI